MGPVCNLSSVCASQNGASKEGGKFRAAVEVGSVSAAPDGKTRQSVLTLGVAENLKVELLPSRFRIVR